MAFDFSTLPKARAYGYMGGLAAEYPEGCSLWNPLTYPQCSTWIISGRTELANAHNQILDLANLWQATLADIQQWPESEAKSNALAEAQTHAQEAYELVQQHSQVQNEYEAKIQPFASIGLAGLGRTRGLGGGLGIILAPWALVTLSSLVITSLAAWGIVSSWSLKSNYEANTAFYNQFSEYYKTCQELARQGKPCTVSGPSTSGPGTAWSSQLTILAMLAGVAAIMVLSRR